MENTFHFRVLAGNKIIGWGSKVGISSPSVRFLTIEERNGKAIKYTQANSRVYVQTNVHTIRLRRKRDSNTILQVSQGFFPSSLFSVLFLKKPAAHFTLLVKNGGEPVTAS